MEPLEFVWVPYGTAAVLSLAIGFLMALLVERRRFMALFFSSTLFLSQRLAMILGIGVCAALGHFLGYFTGALLATLTRKVVLLRLEVTAPTELIVATILVAIPSGLFACIATGMVTADLWKRHVERSVPPEDPPPGDRWKGA